MPVSTPHRIADPVKLERYDAPTVIKQGGELSVNYYNPTGNTILQGEPVLYGGRVGIAQSVILPGTQGTLVMDWIIEARIGGTLVADVIQGATIWWSYDVTSVVAGVGGAVRAAPTNGFLLGTAVIPTGAVSLDGLNKALAAPAGATVVRVMNTQEPSPAIGTVPTFN